MFFDLAACAGVGAQDGAASAIGPGGRAIRRAAADRDGAAVRRAVARDQIGAGESRLRPAERYPDLRSGADDGTLARGGGGDANGRGRIALNLRRESSW